MNLNNINTASSVGQSNNYGLRNVANPLLKAGPYIAWPKSKTIAAVPGVPAHYPANDATTASLFIAYPKTITELDVINLPEAETQPGEKTLYIAYPEKKKYRKFKVEKILDAPKAVLQNNMVVVNLLQLLRAKVS